MKGVKKTMSQMSHLVSGLIGVVLAAIPSYSYYKNRHRLYENVETGEMRLLTNEELKSVLYFSTEQRDPKFRQPN